ncbi:DUF998 domain-containing protein [Streptosporangium amethystogenes]|uniref:DUF998 domain-containing protein n=1 Tax=Streptosporangium amethystogenes TaxID=2002 RepID=UPI0004CACF45|nr:DUF998 domain-containing protein [Streptosporangium amethystogenes]
MCPTAILLGCGIAAGALVPAVLLIDGATRPGYSLWRHSASQLGTGERGWLQTANFVIGGLLLLAFAAGLAFRLDIRDVLRPAPAGLLEHVALLVGFAWIIAVGVRLRRHHPVPAQA